MNFFQSTGNVENLPADIDALLPVAEEFDLRRVDNKNPGPYPASRGGPGFQGSNLDLYFLFSRFTGTCESSSQGI